jgi:hypothetical protein
MYETITKLFLTSNVQIYLLGAFGSLGVELAAVLREVTVSDGQLPPRFKTRSYIFVRVLFAIFAAGPLAVLLATKADWTAFYIGITAPLIFDRAAAGLKPDSKGGPPLNHGTQPRNKLQSSRVRFGSIGANVGATLIF